mmetsp:Transcript_29830/g.55862  ORF Transcript_29830/g.55862 Transcript_29830/m.55862 type:complete len:323 (-) Transcript_29830:91-1059(-)
MAMENLWGALSSCCIGRTKTRSQEAQPDGNLFAPEPAEEEPPAQKRMDDWAVPAARRQIEPQQLPRPIRFLDPRSLSQADVGLLAFYYPGEDTDWDRLCVSGFLGNFYPLEDLLCLEAPSAGPRAERRTAGVADARHRQVSSCRVWSSQSSPNKLPGRVHEFRNAEAAFQALKFWDRAQEFEELSGGESFNLKWRLRGQEDFSYGGFGSNWNGMLQVLRAKFRPGTQMARLLESTGEAFLLEHNARADRDAIWSDNFHGDGLNWLGLQLMLVREEQRDAKPWTAWLSEHVDLRTGKVDQDWQNAVQLAVQSLNQELALPSRM